MIRFGTHTLFKNNILRLIIEKDLAKLIYYGSNPPSKDFNKYEKNIFILKVPTTTITNAFFIQTKCMYKNFVFDVEQEQDESYRIVTASKDAFQELNLEFRDREVYQTTVKKNELEEIWEERKESYDGLSFPIGVSSREKISL